jgi:hypothetical protein
MRVKCNERYPVLLRVSFSRALRCNATHSVSDIVVCCWLLHKLKSCACTHTFISTHILNVATTLLLLQLLHIPHARCYLRYLATFNYDWALLPVARTSSLLSCIGLWYEETLGLHKLFAVMAVSFLTVHFTCQFPGLIAGWQCYGATMWDPTVQPGQWNFHGMLH